MYPIIRTLWMLAVTSEENTIRPDEPVEYPLICWPWDVDPFMEMNNGRQMTMFDIGRFQYGKRGGLLRCLRENKWGLAVAGSSVQYRKRILPFQKLTMHTLLLARDEQWFYFQQTLLRKNDVCSSALVRTCVLKPGRGALPTQPVAEAMGWPDWRGDLPDWAIAWDQADKARPWPPTLTASAPSAPDIV